MPVSESLRLTAHRSRNHRGGKRAASLGYGAEFEYQESAILRKFYPYSVTDSTKVS